MQKTQRVVEHMAYITGPGGHIPDRTGPYGRGIGPGKGRSDGTGLLAIVGSTTAPSSVPSGPGGNIPDGKGPKGAGMGLGPGRGKRDGSGLETLAKSLSGPSTRSSLHTEYAAVYSEYGSSPSVRAAVAKAHTEAVAQGITGQARRNYVKSKAKAAAAKKSSSSAKTGKTSAKK